MIEWRKSSYSGNSSECIEVGCSVGIRDSKAPAAHLAIGTTAWVAFLNATKADKLTR